MVKTALDSFCMGLYKDFFISFQYLLSKNGKFSKISKYSNEEESNAQDLFDYI